MSARKERERKREKKFSINICSIMKRSAEIMHEKLQKCFHGNVFPSSHELWKAK
jgi:hypothetical protein